MAKRLTGFSKLIITLLILGALVFGVRWFLNNTSYGSDIMDKAEEVSQESTSGSSNSGDSASNSGSSNNGTASGSTAQSNRNADDNTLRVQLVTWGGYGPGLYFNEGAKANKNSRYFKDYGFNVEFVLQNDLVNAMNAWIVDDYDIIVQTADAFPLYTSSPDINQYKPKAFMQVDWSRGGDAIIAKRGINTVNDLKGKRIALAVPAPAQTLLISALEAAGLKYTDVTVVKTSDNLKAAELFRSDDIDAAVVWSPDDLIAVDEVPGSKILLTTLDQSHIIADIFFAKEDVINKKQEMFNKFYEGWMRAVSELKNPTNREKSAKYLAEFNQLGIEDGMGMIETCYWTTHGDNRNFFGLNSGYKGQKMSDLYGKMSKKFVETGDAETVAPNWRSVVNLSAIQNASGLTTPTHDAEKKKVFTPATSKDRQASAIATKPISINFSSGQFQLSENAKTIIDLQFAEVAKSFGNMRIRVEGNTDNVGSRQMNQELSKKRANSVVKYLNQAYGLDVNKFVVVGNGPDKPVPGCESNANDACKAKNRRTEFQLIPG